MCLSEHEKLKLVVETFQINASEPILIFYYTFFPLTHVQPKRGTYDRVISNMS